MKCLEQILQQYDCCHIRGKSENGPLFTGAEAYRRFLRLYSRRLAQMFDTYGYCLLPDHFHLLVRQKAGVSPLISAVTFGKMLKDFFAASSSTAGSVPEPRPVVHQRFTSVNHFAVMPMLACIHIDPQKHGCCADYRHYEYSSFRSLLSGPAEDLAGAQVFAWFKTRDRFRKFHDDIKPIHIGSKFRVFNEAG